MEEKKLTKGGVIKEITKCGLSLVSGVGIYLMMKTGVNILTPETAGKLTKACCKVAGMVLTCAIGRAASDELDKIDNETTETVSSMLKIVDKGMSALDETPDNPEEPTVEIVK